MLFTNGKHNRQTLNNSKTKSAHESAERIAMESTHKYPEEYTMESAHKSTEIDAMNPLTNPRKNAGYYQ